MKKSLIALAVLATAGVASAQSSVTLFGIVDATLAHGSGSIANKTQLTNSGYNSSRLGFRGTEDLGGGMSASFWLEAGLANDDGQGAATNSNNQASGVGAAVAGRQGLTFNRRSTVSLAGNWGEVRLGRDYTPQFWNLTVFDPFGTNGVGTTQVFNSQIAGLPSGAGLYPLGSTGPVVRASNSIGYFLPGNLGGFYGQAQYYLGENASNVAAPVGSKDGDGLAFRAGYANGPFNVALSGSKTKYATGDVTSTNIGGDWNFGVAELMGEYSWDKIDSPVSVKARGGLIGALVPVGVGQIRLAYSYYRFDTLSDPKAKKLALGYVHNLSKRTALYATYARVSNSGGANQALNGAATAANESSNGYDFGIRHSF
jgi:predicted porin